MVWNESAGKIYRHEPSVHARWQTLFTRQASSLDGYEPFCSQLDWEVAQWAVKEQISQTSLNRFLKIPDVSVTLLVNCLDFDNCNR